MAKVLITPLYGMGDSLLITPAIKILKKNRPDFNINLLTFQKTTYELLLNNPYIDNLIFYPILDRSKIDSLIYIFKNISFKYDIVINFYPSNRIDYNLFSFLTMAKERLGHIYSKSNFSQLNWLKNRKIKEDIKLHCVEENIKLLELIGIKTNEIPSLEVYLTEKELTNGKNYIAEISKKKIKVGIHTGTSSFKNHIHRRWPKERFLELVDSLYNIDFFLFGTKEEEKENKYILENCKNNNVILIENRNIREVASIIKNLDLFISNDSGLMHLAAAIKTPVVAIFGPTNPVWVRPWGVKHRVIKLGLDCSPCFYYSPKPLTCHIKEKFKCIKEIKTEMVKKAILEILDISY